MFQLTWGAMQQILKLCDVIKDFLFSEFKIGEYYISMWALLAGVLFATFMIMWFVKKLIPVA